MVIEKLYNDHVSELSFVLKPSKLAGVGLFTLHYIRKGVLLHRDNAEEIVRKTKNLPPPLLGLCIFKNKEEALCPKRFDTLSVWSFINHSSKPNVEYREKDKTFFALRDLQAGEELFFDYNQLNEPEELKEKFYKNA